MYLELADHGEPHNGPAYLGANTPPSELLEYMLQIPTDNGGSIWVREDQLDGLTDEELYMILEQQPHLSGIRDMFGRMKERRAGRKAERQAGRIEGKEQRFAFREQKRGTRAGRKGGSLIERLTTGVTKVVGGMQPSPPQYMEPGSAADYFPQVTGGASIGVAKWWQNPAVLGLGGLIVIGGIVYFVTKDKKK